MGSRKKYEFAWQYISDLIFEGEGRTNNKNKLKGVERWKKEEAIHAFKFHTFSENLCQVFFYYILS